MKFSLTYLKSTSRAFVKEFDTILNTSTQDKTISLHDLKLEKNQLLLFSDEFDENNYEETVKEITENSIDFVLESSEKWNIDEETYKDLTCDKAWSIFKKSLSNWVLIQNLTTIENLFSLSSNLKELRAKQRNLFFDELWNTLKVNLGASFLRLVYYDLDEDAFKKDKHKLIPFTTLGNNIPAETRQGEKFEEELLKTYSPICNSPLQIVEYDALKGNLLLLSSINQSTLIIMANVYFFDPLQQSLLKGLFEGLKT